MLLVVGVIVAGLATTNPGGSISGEITRLLCQIAGGTDCTGSADRRTAKPTDDEAPRPADSGRAPRRIHDLKCGDDGDLPGDLVRETGEDPTGDPEADAVYTNLGRTYDYFADTFGRDSFDSNGATLVASINLCEGGVPAQNAFWNGEQMAFGEGYGNSLDVTAHELTHAITERTAGLEYECQPGALNEAMSDIFASNVDPEDWEIGENLPGGALRDMPDPGKGDPPQPGHVDDFDTRPNDGDPFNDHGGVHYNSGIINRAYYLMVQSMGRDAAERIVYKALTEGLEADSSFEDFRTAALAAATELYGADGPEVADADAAFRAVGLDGTWEAPEIEGC